MLTLSNYLDPKSPRVELMHVVMRHMSYMKLPIFALLFVVRVFSASDELVI